MITFQNIFLKFFVAILSIKIEGELVAFVVTYKSNVKIVKSNFKNVRSNIKAKFQNIATFPKNFTIQYDNRCCDTMVDMDDDRDLLDRKSNELVVLHDIDSGEDADRSESATNETESETS